MVYRHIIGKKLCVKKDFYERRLKMDTGHCARLEDEVRPNDESPYYKISVYIIAPEGFEVDEFVARQIIGRYKKMLDADYEEET